MFDQVLTARIPSSAITFKDIAHLQVGFGWSDKPVREEDYTYERHVAWNEDLLFNYLQVYVY